LFGYAGKILRVDLTEGRIRYEPLKNEMIENFLGGAGFATSIIYNEVPPLTPALSPENKLIFAIGPVTGTTWLGSSRWVVLKQILEESVMMSLVGSIIAVGLSFFFVDMLNNVLLGGSTIAIITPALAIGAIAYGVLITVIFSLYPAWVAVKTDPIDAIRNG